MQEIEHQVSEAVETDLDVRLIDVWTEILCWPQEKFTIKDVGVLIRAAYAQGHCNAMCEADPSMIYRKHGYRVPRRCPR